MSKTKKYTNAEAKQLIEDISGVLVRAREIQHLCWEMQHNLLRVGENAPAGTDGLIELEQTLFQTSRKLAEKMEFAYNALPESVKKEHRFMQFSSYVEPSRYVRVMYDDITQFGEFDEISQRQIAEMYNQLASSKLNESEETE